jgi:hypothetical protein
MHFLDDFYDVLFKPKTAFARLSQRTNIGLGLFIYLVVVLVANLSSMDVISPSQLALDMEQWGFAVPADFFKDINRIAPLISAVSVLTFGPLLFLARTALLSLSAALLGGKNDSRSLGHALGYAQLPSVLGGPLCPARQSPPLQCNGSHCLGTLSVGPGFTGCGPFQRLRPQHGPGGFGSAAAAVGAPSFCHFFPPVFWCFLCPADPSILWINYCKPG